MRIFREVSLADSLTVLNALFGFSAIAYAIHDFEKSFALFYLALISDGLDGWIASKTEKSRIGKELDSLADSISFGIFPAVAMIVYNISLFAFSSLFLAFSILRLARFNILSLEGFLGIPTSVSAIAITSLVRIQQPFEVIATTSVILSILMISDLNYPRLKGVYLTIPGIFLLLAIFYLEFCYLLLLSVIIYTLYPVVDLWKKRLIKGQLQVLKRE
ncbi:MAG: CDP-diacylglycerol--serine O-phosphatidyltransferase [Archaeoglobaceae archaeon]|nr:CDP-diacylglycerol--serine O-phosphatidyltransferase [Archaeoglobaceae archaeon]MDW8117679.1 CDP-diacylglycerol--serine O-phosphatidyltransferase [Archaeoglobaceae archaeon]